MLKTGLKLLTPADIILIVVILAGDIGSYLFLHKDKNDLSAYIYYKNALFGVYPLSHNQVISITDNCTAEIKNGKIRMVKSDCPDKRCVHQGWSNVLPIICLPNQIVIEIKSDKNKQQIHILQ
jgi:hypothetical protein